ncbi:Endonuclease/exonuclease/phosphatase family protein [Heracleum sosnowskyi]|uniref:Endonuclease/exonuclease/phosphatase family protein n=1 Tax=Heracleum sosnowskyi TaxID=360622 RepID=A0AAD8HK84_9APIA|nr:Endonuclease/exonuclease/phosphatase family protein [Heracleum sosnowskyi]
MIIQSSDHPYILAGGLNSLNISDYSPERWTDIIRYYQSIRKPTPKVEVTNFLRGEEYIDAKDFAGDCEPVVMIANDQNVQGTCKYGTRVDYIMASQDLYYKFVPETYSVISSKGTSDHHLVKVDIVTAADRRPKKLKQKVSRIASSCSCNGMWKID